MPNCPVCGKNCKNAFYLGRHVSQKKDSQHVYDSNNSKPDLSDSITNDSSGAEKENVTPGDDNVTSSGSSQTVEWETETEDNWRELKPNDSREAELLAQGYEEINMDSQEVR